MIASTNAQWAFFLLLTGRRRAAEAATTGASVAAPCADDPYQPCEYDNNYYYERTTGSFGPYDNIDVTSMVVDEVFAALRFGTIVTMLFLLHRRRRRKPNGPFSHHQQQQQQSFAGDAYSSSSSPSSREEQHPWWLRRIQHVHNHRRRRKHTWELGVVGMLVWWASSSAMLGSITTSNLGLLSAVVGGGGRGSGRPTLLLFPNLSQRSVLAEYAEPNTGSGAEGNIFKLDQLDEDSPADSGNSGASTEAALPARAQPLQQSLQSEDGRRLHIILNHTASKPELRSWRNIPLHVDGSPKNRAIRFPSIKERVMFYMSSWYAPPCPKLNGADQVTFRVVDPKASGDDASRRKNNGLPPTTTWYAIEGITQEGLGPQARRQMFAPDAPLSDTLFVLNRKHLLNCIEKLPPAGNQQQQPARQQQLPVSIRASYCPDLLETIVPLWVNNNTSTRQNTGTTPNGESQHAQDDQIPLLIQVGDARVSRLIQAPGEKATRTAPRVFPTIPHLSKTRPAFREFTWSDAPACQGRQTTRQGYLPRIIWKLNRKRHYKDLDTVVDDDIPWEKKKNMAVFRGTSTGRVAIEDPSELSRLSVREQCRLRKRCALVDQYMNSSMINSKLVPGEEEANEYPEEYYGDALTRAELLQYKALIMLQGNDVSSGLKWAMMSNSVVMMPVPTVSSWFMEELLQPFVHFVPIKDDMSNAEEQLQWIMRNEGHAQQIARRAALWVQDMLFHEDAKNDEIAINKEILRRYRNLFNIASAPKQSTA